MKSTDKKKRSVIKFKRRYFLLLEVLIAFVFVAAATLPLLYPHFYIYQKERQFIDKLDLDMAIQALYGGIYEQLQKNQISWNTIIEKQPTPINEQFWNQIGFPQYQKIKGDYQFKILLSKKNTDYGLYLVELTINIVAKPPEKNADYKYQIFISRIFSKVS